MHAAEIGVATRSVKASPSFHTPTPYLPPSQNAPSPHLSTANPALLPCQQAPQAILKQSDGGAAAANPAQPAQQEAACIPSLPLLPGSSHDGCDALPASSHEHQRLNDTEGSGSGLSSDGCVLGGKIAGQASDLQQSSSLQQGRRGSGLLAVCLEVGAAGGVSLRLQPGKQDLCLPVPCAQCFASAFQSLHLRLCLCLSMCPCHSPCLSFCLSICFYLCLCLCLSICLSSSLCQSLRPVLLAPSISLALCPSLCAMPSPCIHLCLAPLFLVLVLPSGVFFGWRCC